MIIPESQNEGTEVTTQSHIDRYRILQAYVGWTDRDTARISALAPLVEPFLGDLIDDFYSTIERHEPTRKIIVGGDDQIVRLKHTLNQWVHELFRGDYDEQYVERRWRVGYRHVEIGLEEVYTNTALSRLRTGLAKAIRTAWRGDLDELHASIASLNTLLDLDLAIIEDAYQTEYASRMRAAEAERRALIKQQGETKFRNLVETADCAIVILRPDKSIAYFSPFAERLTGYASEQVLGKVFIDHFLVDGDRAIVNAEFDRVLDGKSRPAYESTITRRDGACRRMSWNCRILADFEGSPALLTVGHDITDLKQSQERALQAERLAAIGQVVTGLAHESRNALQRSQACLEMLEREVRDRPRAIELIDRIQKAQDQLHHLYEDVRGYAAPILLIRRECPLVDVWREAWADLEGQRKGRDAALLEDIDDVDTNSFIDPFRIKMVFCNIFENALAACVDPVTIRVRVREAAIEQQPSLEISVLDNGPGIGPEARERIFEPFFTTKTRGTGLGMAITRRIVEAHGGNLALGDGQAAGAEILITLPRGMP